MKLQKPQQIAVCVALALLMAATRFHHFLPIPDASWAVFFLGGFYLAGASRWAFPLLMLQAALIDYVTTQHLGVSDYCISPAYSFLIPTHALLWFGGWWLQARQRFDWLGLARLGGSAFVAVTLAYVVSNGSFYWLGGKIAAPDWNGYRVQFLAWYPHFLSVPLAYIAIASVLHLLVLRLRGAAVERGA